MAAHDVIFLTNDANTRKKWAKDLFHVMLKANEFNDLIGSGSDSIIQMRTELGKGEGDQITFAIRRQLLGEGVVGTDTVEGNEEKIRFKDFSMLIEELNHAIDTGGRMDEQRVPFDIMQEGKDALSDWWADKLSDYVINTLAGNSTYKIAGKTFAQACTEPDTGHLITVNDVAEASISSSEIMDLSFLDRMKQRAELPSTGCDKVRPLKIKGKNYFRVILHNYVFDQLKSNTNVGQWGDIQRAAGKLTQDVPMNVELEYNGMLVSKSERLPSLYTNVYRAVLLGAQAATFAWGGAGESKSTTLAFVPYEKDAKRYIMIRSGGIFGCKKVVFNSTDNSVITAASYATALN
jgi:N4-gp56 family major capsid protein